MRTINLTSISDCGSIIITEFGTTNNMTIVEAEKLAETKELHFIAGVNPESEKRKKSDIIEKNYFVIDIDIRDLIYKEHNIIISDEELKTGIETIKKELDSHENFSKRKYIVWSGNGCHIYYVGDYIDLELIDYEETVAEIYLKFDREILDAVGLECDKNCNTINHLFRLPGSLNKKRKRYGLEPSVSKILWEQEVKSDLLEIYSIDKTDGEHCLSAECRESFQSSLKRESDILVEGESAYQYIIDNVDVGELFQQYFGLRRSKDEKNFISNKDHSYVGVFYDEQNNILIGYEGNHYLPSTRKGRTAWTFVKEVLGFGDATLQRFLDHYEDVQRTQAEAQRIYAENLSKNRSTIFMSDKDTARLLAQC